MLARSGFLTPARPGGGESVTHVAASHGTVSHQQPAGPPTVARRFANRARHVSSLEQAFRTALQVREQGGTVRRVPSPSLRSDVGVTPRPFRCQQKTPGRCCPLPQATRQQCPCIPLRSVRVSPPSTSMSLERSVAAGIAPAAIANCTTSAGGAVPAWGPPSRRTSTTPGADIAPGSTTPTASARSITPAHGEAGRIWTALSREGEGRRNERTAL